MSIMQHSSENIQKRKETSKGMQRGVTSQETLGGDLLITPTVIIQRNCFDQSSLVNKLQH